MNIFSELAGNLSKKKIKLDLILHKEYLKQFNDLNDKCNRFDCLRLKSVSIENYNEDICKGNILFYLEKSIKLIIDNNLSDSCCTGCIIF